MRQLVQRKTGVPILTDEEWSAEHDRRIAISEQSAATWETVAVISELMRHQR
jgi:hypothetical protein